MPKRPMTYDERLANKIAFYKKISAWKSKPEAEIIAAAEKAVKLWMLIDDLDIEEQFQDTDEQKKAEELATKYFNDYVFEFTSEKNTLKQLIFLEIINYRLQKSLNEFYKDAGAGAPPQMLESLHKNLMQIIELKKILGLAKSDKKEQDGSNPMELLKKKFKVWRQNNQAGRTIVCPHCSKMVLLKIRTDAWEAQKHPYFKDRLLGNEHLVALYKAKIITKEDVAKILGTSPDYTTWLTTKWQNSMPQVAPVETEKEVASIPSVFSKDMPTPAVLVHNGKEVYEVLNGTEDSSSKEA